MSMRASVLGAMMAVAVTAGCRNIVGDEADAGVLGAEGEGEGEAAEGEGEGDCPDEPVFGMVVVVEDGVTRNPLCDATVVITEGAFSETLAPRGVLPDCDFAGALDRVGVYEISASHVDYPPPGGPQFVDIAVTGDECGHAIFRRVVVALNP